VERAGWLRCSSVTDRFGYAPSSRLAIRPFPRKQCPFYYSDRLSNRRSPSPPPAPSAVPSSFARVSTSNPSVSKPNFPRIFLLSKSAPPVCSKDAPSPSWVACGSATPRGPGMNGARTSARAPGAGSPRPRAISWPVSKSPQRTISQGPSSCARPGNPRTRSRSRTSAMPSDAKTYPLEKPWPSAVRSTQSATQNSPGSSARTENCHLYRSRMARPGVWTSAHPNVASPTRSIPRPACACSSVVSVNSRT
jgi:hypothetical protein